MRRAERALLSALLVVAGTATATTAPLRERAQVVPAAFTVVEITPGPKDLAVPRNTAVAVRFSGELDPASVTPERLRLEGVATRIAVRGTVAFLQPDKPLAPGVHQVIVGTGIADRAGALLLAPAAGEFRTSAALWAGGAPAVPSAAGRTELFRYPYLLVDGPGRLRVAWGTRSAGVGTAFYQAVGESSWTAATATSRPFPPDVTGIDGFYRYEAALEGLLPDTSYRYRIVHRGLVIAQEFLKTLPAAGAPTVRFVAFGDSGTPYGEPRAVRDAILARQRAGDWIYPHDFTVGLGDIAYNAGTHAEFETRFFAQLSGKGDRGDGAQSLLSRRPFVPVLGNHEYANQEASQPEGFLAAFSAPAVEGMPEPDRGKYYSFEAGPAHFLVVDTMKFVGLPTEALRAMLSWVARDLERTRARWRIVFFHHAPFAHGPHGTYGDLRQNRAIRTQLVPLLQQHGVQLVINSHDHLYERTKRIRVNEGGRLEREPDCRLSEPVHGIVYVTVGTGGDDLHNRSAEPTPCGAPGYDAIVREYGEGYDFVALRPDGSPVIFDATDREPRLPVVRHGFLHVEVRADSLLGTAYNVKGEVLDRFTLP